MNSHSGRGRGTGMNGYRSNRIRDRLEYNNESGRISHNRNMNGEQYEAEIIIKSDATIENLSSKMETLKNKLKKTENKIGTTSSISSLYDTRSAIQSSVKQDVLECQSMSLMAVESFFSDAATAAHNVNQYYKSAETCLVENINSQTLQLNALQEQLTKCGETIKQLQLTYQQLHGACEKTQAAITEFTYKKARNNSAMNESICLISKKKEDVKKQHCDLMLQLIQMNCMKTLQGMMRNKIKDFEGCYTRWSVNDVISWVKFIEDGYFDCKEHESFLNQIIRLNVDGTQIRQMNSKLWLKTLGLDVDSQNILMRNIARITKQPNSNICGVCVSNIINTVMLPCGHQYFCHECSIQQQFYRCPICRNGITQIIKTFMAGVSND